MSQKSSAAQPGSGPRSFLTMVRSALQWWHGPPDALDQCAEVAGMKPYLVADADKQHKSFDSEGDRGEVMLASAAQRAAPRLLATRLQYQADAAFPSEILAVIAAVEAMPA